MNTPGSVNPDKALNAPDEIHRFWWLYVPIAFFILRYLVHLFTNAENGVESWFRHELGIVENLTVAILLLALVLTLSLLIRFFKSVHFILKAFLIIYCLGCIYFAGEEASWGQHWFGWESTEFFTKHNDQGETNIHNTSHLFDRTPKGIISALILIGGVIVPLTVHFKSLNICYSKRFWWVWPTWVCLPTAMITTLSTVPSKIEHWTGYHFYFDQTQEMKECYIAYFILLYILSLGRRMRHLRLEGESFSPL